MKEFLIEETDDFLYLTLNRPEKHNSLNTELMLQIINTLESYKKKLGHLKALVLKGNGASFCAGADLNWMKSMVNYSLEENKEDSLKLFNLFEALNSFPLPVITYAHGNVYGGGLGFLGAADYVIAEKDTKFCFSEVKLGLIPAVISSFILSKCSHSFSRALMTSGEVFTAGKAFHMGLVQQIDKDQTALEDVLKNYSQSSQEALIECKKVLKSQELMSPQSMKDLTINSISKLRTSNSAQTRMNNFLNKKNKK